MDDLDNFIDKLRGVPAVPETHDHEVGQEIKEVRSSAQLSYDNLAGHFSGLIDFTAGIKGGYLPNEEDLQLPALEAVLTRLLVLNERVSSAETDMENAAIARNRALYAEEEGLYDRTQTVKKYVLSVYGTNSAEFKQVKKIKFRDQEIKTLKNIKCFREEAHFVLIKSHGLVK